MRFIGSCVPQAALVTLLARPAGSIATTDPAATAAADGMLWRSLSGPHHALV